jgi:hypothetical protein
MKKLMHFFSGLLILVSLSTLISCNNDDDSSYQPKGNYGNAMMHSQTFNNVGWTQYGTSYSCIINDADITQAMVDKGQVNVYMENGTGVWETLPYFWPITPAYGVSIAIQYSLGQVRIEIINTNFSQTSDPGSKNFKITSVEPL